MNLLKEWAVVCGALDAGRQIFIARKGGIAEEEGEFVLRNREFYLLPGFLHQNKEAIKPAFHYPLEQTAAEEPSKIHLKNLARVTDSWKVTDLNRLKGLDAEHVWTEGFFRKRFEWGSEASLTVIVLRVFRLEGEIVLPMKKEYGGCKSWVVADNVIDQPICIPVLSDLEFQEKRTRIARILTP